MDSFQIGGASLNWHILMVYTPLLLALVSCLFHKFRITLPLILLSVVMGLFTGILASSSLVSILLLFATCFYFSHTQKAFSKLFTGALIFLLCTAFMLHIVPGFNNPLIIDDVLVSDGAVAYSKFLNFDKGLLAVVLLLFVVPKPTKVSQSQLIAVANISCIVSLLVFAIGLMSGFVAYDPKISDFLLAWMLTNLFFTCFVEEAVFRGFVQEQLNRMLIGSKSRMQISVLVSGIFFGLVHAAAGGIYVLLASIMGCVYAYSYAKTKNIYVPITVHFVFNLSHFTLFSYPFLR